MKKITYLFYFTIFLMIGCEKEEPQTDNNQYEKITKIFLGSELGSGFVINDSILQIKSFAYDFNKDDYSNIDSIKFLVFDCINPAQMVQKIQLVDLINKSIIENSTILIPSKANLINLKSENLINSFSNNPVKLGIQINFRVGDSFAYANSYYLYLYRKIK